MTYQEKVAVIDGGRASLENGTSWNDFQAQLISIPAFYQKDVDATGVKVIRALEAKYADTIESQLAESGTVAPIDGLHESVQAKLVDRKTTEVKNRLKNKITNQVLRGGDPRTVLLQNEHPLLTKSLAQTALNNVQRRSSAAAGDDGGSSMGVVWAVIAVILFIVKLALAFAD